MFFIVFSEGAWKMIRLHNVTKKFGNNEVLKGIDLTINKGEVVSIVGPSGAGKTTLIRILNQITAPDSGEVLINGEKPAQKHIATIGYLPEERGLYKKMKVGEQAVFFARLRGMSKSDATARLHEWFSRLNIEDWWEKKVEDLSKGMAQKVQFIATVVHEPKLLIFDEPFSGFDPINQDLLKNEILGLRDRGATVIFSTHNMESVEEICDDITLINKSQNILSGPVEEIRRKAGGNTFLVVYSGQASDLINAINGKATLIGQAEGLIGGYTQQKIHIADNADVRPVIGALNDSVMLRSFQEIIPSMNDIFIRTVGGTL